MGAENYLQIAPNAIISPQHFVPLLAEKSFLHHPSIYGPSPVRPMSDIVDEPDYGRRVGRRDPGPRFQVLVEE
jgi:hypothetical protein